MSKQTYLDELETLLDYKRVRREDIKSIIDDYDDLYSSALDRGLSDEEIVSQLGTPSDVYKELKRDLTYQEKPSQKIVALSPFIALILFIVIGNGFDLWQYAWLTFLLIPITATFVNARGKNKIIAAMPFLSLITFMILGLGFKLWHPGWLIFLLTPMTAILLTGKIKDTLISISPFISIIVFMVLGIEFNLWHPGWLVFLLTPIVSIMLNGKTKNRLIGVSPFISLVAFILWTYYDKNIYVYAWLLFLLTPMVAYIFEDGLLKKLFGVASMAIAILAYIFMIQRDIAVGYAIIPFLLPVIYAVSVGYIKVEFSIVNKNWSKVYLILMILVTTTYLTVSFLTGVWHITWIILLLIPCLAIHASEGFKYLVSYMPFIATIIFVGGGHLFGYWQYLWMAYLLIPIVAIIQGDKKIVSVKHNDTIDAEFEETEE